MNSRRLVAVRAPTVVLAVAIAAVGCKFPYPADVPGDGDVVGDDGAPAPRALGGTVDGLWTGGAVTLHLEARDASENLAASATAPFTFTNRLADDTSYLVTVADDGPDHDCTISNGSGRVMGADITDLAVTCTSLIPHSIAISTAVPFTFDPRVTRYPLAVSLLQQEVTVLVTGPTLTSATVAGQAVTIGQPSAPVTLADGQTTVAVEVAKGGLSRRYDLVFDRGATPVAETLYARATNADPGDGFGISVASSGDYLAVGAWYEDSSTTAGVDNATSDSGAVYIFHRSGLSWTPSQRLKGSAITANRYFGHALAMDHDVLVVGAFGDDARGTDAGAAYVFRLGADGRWAEEQRLTASDAHAADQFGSSVGVSGDLVAIGSPFHDRVANSGDQTGAIYTYRRNGATWVEDPLLRPPSGSGYGWRVAIDGNALAMGAFSRAQIYVYRRSGASWVQESLPNVAGTSIDLDRDVLAVGQPFAPTPGDVRIFSRVGTSWTETGLLQATNPAAGAKLGTSVSLRGDIVITSETATPTLQIFHRVGGTWTALPPLTVSGSPMSQNLSFGSSTALNGNSAAIGSYGDGGPGNALPGSGTVWLFR